MKDIHKLCRICLNEGTRDIYNNDILARNFLTQNPQNENELARIAEKLRFVTMLKVSELSSKKDILFPIERQKKNILIMLTKIRGNFFSFNLRVSSSFSSSYNSFNIAYAKKKTYCYLDIV